MAISPLIAVGEAVQGQPQRRPHRLGIDPPVFGQHVLARDDVATLLLGATAEEAERGLVAEDQLPPAVDRVGVEHDRRGCAAQVRGHLVEKLLRAGWLIQLGGEQAVDQAPKRRP